MINDAARKYTDRELELLEKRLHAKYSRAFRELNETWAEYMEQHRAQMQPLYERMQKLKNGDRTEYLAAKREYQRAMREHTLKDRHYRRVRDTLAHGLANLDQAAKDLINGKLPAIYTVNFNQLAGQLPGGYAYGLITPQTVRGLVMGQMDFASAVEWNKQLMNSEVLQGILRGESMDKIAARFAHVLGMNETAAMRDARTAVTYAENQGRLDSYYEAESKGTVLVKVWNSVDDGRTRDSHKPMPTGVGGEERPIDEPFSNGLMCPGDSGGAAHEIYNCRCAMGTRIIGFRRKDGSIEYV